MHNIAYASSKYLQRREHPTTCQYIAQSIVDFIREHIDDSTLNPLSIVKDYQLYTTKTGKGFRWIDRIQGMDEQEKIGLLRGIVSFFNFVKGLDVDKAKAVLDAFMLAFKPVVVYCETCEACSHCFGPGKRHEHVRVARAEGVVAPMVDKLHMTNNGCHFGHQHHIHTVCFEYVYAQTANRV